MTSTIIFTIVFFAIGLLAILDAIFQVAARWFGLVTIVQGHVVAEQGKVGATILRIVEFILGGVFIVCGILKAAGVF